MAGYKNWQNAVKNWGKAMKTIFSSSGLCFDPCSLVLPQKWVWICILSVRSNPSYKRMTLMNLPPISKQGT